MKLTITTLTGDKFDVEVKAEDKVKDVKVSNRGITRQSGADPGFPVGGGASPPGGRVGANI